MVSLSNTAKLCKDKDKFTESPCNMWKGPHGSYRSRIVTADVVSFQDLIFVQNAYYSKRRVYGKNVIYGMFYAYHCNASQLLCHNVIVTTLSVNTSGANDNCFVNQYRR